MKQCSVLYNPYSGNNNGEQYAKKLNEIMKGYKLEFISILDIKDYKKIFKTKKDIIICGGDGTLNYFINNTKNIKYKNEILYYQTGTGNDFHNDIGNKVEIPYNINKYLTDLPTVTVKGKEYKFLNGVGFGIDGYCCEVGDRKKAKSSKPVNYTSIAIKGLLYGYKRTNATVTVDGEKHFFRNVWLAPTMNGRYYGGGMMVAPDQDRLNKKRELTTVVMHCPFKLKTLIAFPSIFEGKHIEKDKIVTVLKGYDIKVEFDRPTALQIDGETILAVTEYEAKSTRK